MNTAIDMSLNWDEVFETAPIAEDSELYSIPDALILSLSNLAKVDIGYIARVSGEDRDTVVSALQGAVFQNPEKWECNAYEGWETAEEYLSGNLRSKLRAARKANKEFYGRFSSNIAALKKLLPEIVEAEDIYITLGSPWVPSDIIDDFITNVLGILPQRGMNVIHDEYTGSWAVPLKRRYFSFNNVARQSSFGTLRMDSLEILEKTLNMKTIAVYDEIKTTLTKSGKKRVLNQPETALALEKQQKMIEAFRDWVWKDAKRKERLERIFDMKYGCVRRRLFDGSFLRFPGMSDEIKLYPYQKNAIARIIFSPNTLLAHDVGSGKTYVMIAAGMELRRIGLSKKNLYVVPNNIVSQWQDFFKEIYPDSKVFCVTAKNFTPEKRDETLRIVRDEDWDGVIMAHSCFDRIPLSRRTQLKSLREELDKIKAIEKQNTRKKLVSALKSKREQLGREIERLLELNESTCGSMFFDDLGVTRLFVDEAHNYKNVPIDTDTTRVLGISATGSKKCKDMMDKVCYLQKQNNGGGVVLATGTPITNSLTEVFIMQKYLQGGELAMLEINNFDSWIGMFAEKVTEFEVDVDTSSYRLATRFSRFHNLPELTAMLSSIADFHRVDKSVGIPDFNGYTDTLVERSADFNEYLKEISARAELIRNGKVHRKDDNMLKVTTDGRKAALDLRLVNSKAPAFERSKVARCVENVYSVYKRSSANKGAQLVFCDISTPKESFNVYDEMKRMLIARGIPECEIAYVHDANTESKRSKLFAKVRSGDIRVLIGSTLKLGMGVNVHDRLVAIHHADIPWRPSDMTQREGRILRQGNRNRKVYIYRYITEGSFDAYSWQLLETKQRFISELLAGSLADRSGSDVEDTVLSYAEVKALAVGNPLVKKRVEVANELSRLRSLRHKSVENRLTLEKELLGMPAKIERQTEACGLCEADLKLYMENSSEYDKETRRYIRQLLANAINEQIASASEQESVAMKYHGFDIVLPANMQRDKPYIWLRGSGRYYVELGENDKDAKGALVRIDNFLEKFKEHLKQLKEGLASLKAKKKALADELAKKDNYAEKIDELVTKLAQIDEKLGVKKI